MRILISNDDGIEAPGLDVLVDALRPLGEIWVVAPRLEQSAGSHALTMHRPLRFAEVGERRFWVQGTPADAVYVALHRLLPEPPDLVASGVNLGANIGHDTLYSGTVAAAMEAALWGRPAMAVSLHVHGGGGGPHWETARPIARRLAERLMEDPLPVRSMLNVNVPDLPPDELRGVRAGELCHHHWHPRVDQRTDPFGRPYLWIGGPHDRFAGSPDTDGPSLAAGWATVTPLRADLTDLAALERVRRWSLER